MTNQLMKFITQSGGVGLGSMEFAINVNRPEILEAREFIHVLINEYGLSFIDTADCYCIEESEFGYCERLLAPFIRNHNLLIGSKIGMKREGTAWVKCGNPEYLRKACEQSLVNLGVETIDHCQFHSPDPNVPLLESIGELQRLTEEGKIRSLGICNVTLEQIQEVSTMLNIISVQNPLSFLFYDPTNHDSMLDYCTKNGIVFIAYAPFGGFRNPYVLPTVSDELNSLAASIGLSTYQLALLFLKSLSPTLIAIPGSISKVHIIENLSVREMQLPYEILGKLKEMNF